MITQVNKKAVAKAFSRAASNYDQFSELQRHSGDSLLLIASEPLHGHILDAGCGTGLYSRYWRKEGMTVTGLDLSTQMLETASKQNSAHYYVQGDIDHLPFSDNSFDAVWSNLVVQWSDNLRKVLQHYLRVTRKGGKVFFSTLLSNSLEEVHQAWLQIDELEHANRFLSIEAYSDAIQGLPITYSQEKITLHFPTAWDAMRSLKGIGATHIHKGRASRVLTRKKLEQLEKNWPRDHQGYRLSYHLMYGVLNK